MTQTEGATRSTQRSTLLAAAEQLFAERGIDAVSLRTVMAEAGTNVGAVHYHFGTKEALVEALIEARSGELRDERDRLLSELERQEVPSVRDLAEAFVRPLVPMALDGGSSWVRLVSSIVQTGHHALALLDRTFAPQATRFGTLLRRTDPALDLTTVRFRLAEAMTLTFRVLGDLDAVRRNVAPPGRPAGVDRVLDELVDVVTAILAGPPEARS
ncbi:MAG: putative transcriptional regulator, TetR family [Nocardioides sp.]|nr:putative transcriptional regulator, TetR family [Nocardioides sp.]